MVGQLTIDEAVKQHFANTNADQLSDQEADERVWGHDFLHTLLGTNLASTRSEEITGIYQAVLLRNSECTTIKKPWEDGQHIPPLTEIKERTIPDLRAFVERYLRRYDLKPKPSSQLGDREIELYYNKAVLLEKAISSKLGRHLGEISVSELKDMPITNLTELVNQVDRIWERTEDTKDKLAATAFVR